MSHRYWRDISPDRALLFCLPAVFSCTAYDHVDNAGDLGSRFTRFPCSAAASDCRRVTLPARPCRKGRAPGAGSQRVRCDRPGSRRTRRGSGPVWTVCARSTHRGHRAIIRLSVRLARRSCCLIQRFAFAWEAFHTASPFCGVSCFYLHRQVPQGLLFHRFCGIFIA